MIKRLKGIRMTIIITVAILSIFQGFTALAAQIPTNSDELKQYKLDTVKLGIVDVVDKVMNAIANFLFGIVKYIGWAVTEIFGAAIDQNLASSFALEINSIQSALKSTVFDGFFILALCGAAYMVCVNMLKRNLQGAFGQIVKVVVIFALSSIVATNASEALTVATNVSQSISVGVLVQMNNAATGSNQGIDSYVQSMKESLWKDLVYDHWIYLNFEWTGKSVNESDGGYIIFLHPLTEVREQYAESWDSMAKDAWIERMVYLLVYLIPFFLKCVIYIAVAVISLALQIMAIFYILLAPFILLLAMVPATGGFDLINTWLKKILETQLMVIIITFLLGVIMITDTLFQQLCDDILDKGVIGRIAGIVLQAGVSIFLVINYKAIFKFLGKASKATQAAIRNPGRLKYQIQQSGDAANVLGTGVNAIGSTARMIKSASKAVMDKASKAVIGKPYVQDKESTGSHAPANQTAGINQAEYMIDKPEDTGQASISSDFRPANTQPSSPKHRIRQPATGYAPNKSPDSRMQRVGREMLDNSLKSQNIHSRTTTVHRGSMGSDSGRDKYTESTIHASQWAGAQSGSRSVKQPLMSVNRVNQLAAEYASDSLHNAQVQRIGKERLANSIESQNVSYTANTVHEVGIANDNDKYKDSNFPAPMETGMGKKAGYIVDRPDNGEVTQTSSRPVDTRSSRTMQRIRQSTAKELSISPNNTPLAVNDDGQKSYGLTKNNDISILSKKSSTESLKIEKGELNSKDGRMDPGGKVEQQQVNSPESLTRLEINRSNNNNGSKYHAGAYTNNRDNGNHMSRQPRRPLSTSRIKEKADIKPKKERKVL